MDNRSTIDVERFVSFMAFFFSPYTGFVLKTGKMEQLELDF